MVQWETEQTLFWQLSGTAKRLCMLASLSCFFFFFFSEYSSLYLMKRKSNHHHFLPGELLAAGRADWAWQWLPRDSCGCRCCPWAVLDNNLGSFVSSCPLQLAGMCWVMALMELLSFAASSGILVWCRVAEPFAGLSITSALVWALPEEGLGKPRCKQSVLLVIYFAFFHPLGSPFTCKVYFIWPNVF